MPTFANKVTHPVKVPIYDKVSIAVAIMACGIGDVMSGSKELNSASSIIPPNHQATIPDTTILTTINGLIRRYYHSMMIYATKIQ